MRRSSRLVRAVAALALATAAVTPALTATDEAAAAPEQDVAFEFTDDRIDSSSGLAVVPDEPDYVFTVNDHEPTRIFGIDPGTGRSAVTMRLTGAENVNWEAVTAGRGRNLWVGDIGDNESSRESLMLYRFELPGEPSTGFYPASASYEVTYPDGAHDAETLLVNPNNNVPYIVTKDPKGGRLYRLDNPGPGTNELTKLDGKLPPLLTDGAFRPDGKQFVLRSYTTGYVYDTSGKQLGSFRLPKQQQGEGVSYSANGKSILLSSEGERSEVLRMNVAKAIASGSKKPSAKASAKASEEPTGEAANADEGTNLPNLLFIVTPIVIAVLAALAALFLRRRQPAPSGAHSGGRRERKYDKDEPLPPPSYGQLPEPADGDERGWPVPSPRHPSAASPNGPPGAPPPPQNGPVPGPPAAGRPPQPPPPGQPPGGHKGDVPPPPSGPPGGGGVPAPPGASSGGGRRAAPAGRRSGGRKRRKGSDGGEPFWLRD